MEDQKNGRISEEFGSATKARFLLFSAMFVRLRSCERNDNATPVEDSRWRARNRSAFSKSRTPTRPRSSPCARNHLGGHLSRCAFRIQIARAGGPLRLDRCRSFL